MSAEQGYTLFAQLSIRFILPMPDSWSARKKVAQNGHPHQQRPDLDNLLKAFLDAMASEDGFVWRVTAEKQWGYEGRIEVEG